MEISEVPHVLQSGQEKPGELHDLLGFSESELGQPGSRWALNHSTVASGCACGQPGVQGLCPLLLGCGQGCRPQQGLGCMLWGGGLCHPLSLGSSSVKGKAGPGASSSGLSVALSGGLFGGDIWIQEGLLSPRQLQMLESRHYL